MFERTLKTPSCGQFPSEETCAEKLWSSRSQKVDRGLIPELLPTCGEIISTSIGVVGLMACGGMLSVVAMGDTNMQGQISSPSPPMSHRTL